MTTSATRGLVDVHVGRLRAKIETDPSKTGTPSDREGPGLQAPGPVSGRAVVAPVTQAHSGSASGEAASGTARAGTGGVLPSGSPLNEAAAR